VARTLTASSPNVGVSRIASDCFHPPGRARTGRTVPIPGSASLIELVRGSRVRSTVHAEAMDWRTTYRSLLTRIHRWSLAAEAYLAHVDRVDAHITRNEIESLLIVQQGYPLLMEVQNLALNAGPQSLRERLAPIFREQGFRLTSSPNGVPGVIGYLMTFAAARGHIEDELLRSEAPRRAIVDSAFLHLNRTLVVDQDAQRKWLSAFREGEVACERWGAVHLLQHRVYAFKANALGARTDLILGAPVPLDEQVRATDALVLTEWKIADESTARAKAAEGKRQAQLYADGPLAGIELRSIRYVIIVSERQIVVPNDEQDGDVTYRYVNVAVHPASPSMVARGGQ
jgi:hypothetical protein